jgi:hydroxylamine dehydrogenase
MKRSVVLLCFAALACLVSMMAAPLPAAALQTQAQCLACHGEITPGLVAQYKAGAMGASGEVTCVDCHGGDHEAIDAAGGAVPASVCAGCHPEQYAEFTVSDATGYVNKHALGWTRMTAAARYMVMPEAERYDMCERCHNVGVVSADGSVGKCDSCHTRHVFSAEEARQPEACGTCHMGPDHEQIDMWEKSKHGVVYTTEKERAGGDPTRAPACVTCHMPTQENGAGRPLTHNVSTNITIGTVAQGAVVGNPLSSPKTSVPMRTIPQQTFDLNRQKMLDVCTQCHAWSFAEKQLAVCDAVKADVDALLWDPVMRIRGLWYDGLLDPMPENRPANPYYATAGPNLVNEGHVLVLGGQQLYGGTSEIEQWFFSTYKYDHVSTFKGAYHINPDYSHWFGWSEVNQDRDIIAGQESALRRGQDPGFVVQTTRAVVGQAATFDASALMSWGDASANTFAWWWGDQQSDDASTALSGVAHTYTAPGTYTVRMTCADSDLVNNALLPLACSAKRTTQRTMTVKYAATLSVPSLKRVEAGAKVAIPVTFTSGGATAAGLELWKRTTGDWTPVGVKSVTTAAGVPLSVTFKQTLKKKTSFKVVYAGDRRIWNATSTVRTVKPL